MRVFAWRGVCKNILYSVLTPGCDLGGIYSCMVVRTVGSLPIERDGESARERGRERGCRIPKPIIYANMCTVNDVRAVGTEIPLVLAVVQILIPIVGAEMAREDATNGGGGTVVEIHNNNTGGVLGAVNILQKQIAMGWILDIVVRGKDASCRVRALFELRARRKGG